MKRLLHCCRTGLSLLLVLSLLFGGLILPAGAETGKKYISELKLCVAATWDEAAAALTLAGYQTVAGNLNSGAAEGSNAVCLGYKTTDDPKQALTDIAVLTMNSAYAYTDGDAIERLCGEPLADAAAALRTAVDGFRTAYEAGSTPAVIIYDLLLNFRYGDTTVAELLLGGVEDAVLRQILTEGNLTILSVLLSMLYIGNGDASGRPLISVLNGSGGAAGQTAEAGRIAGLMLEHWDTVREPLLTYQNAAVKWEAGSAAVTAYTSRMDSRSRGAYLLGGAYTQMAGETLSARFASADLTPSDLVPAVQSMSAGQQALAPYLSPEFLLFAGCDNVEKQQPEEGTPDPEEPETGDSEAAKETESAAPGSTYYSIAVCGGVNRKISGKSGFALSPETAKRSAKNVELDWLWDGDALTDQLDAFLGSAYTLFYQTTMRNACGVTFPKPEGEAEDTDSTGTFLREHLRDAVKRLPPVILARALTGLQVAEVAAVSQMSAGAIASVQELFAGSPRAMVGLPQFKVIPGTVIRRLEAGGFLEYGAIGQTILPTAAAVTVDGTQVSLSDVAGEFGDVNGWSGSQWGAVYTTRDESAGKPIYAAEFCILADQENAALSRNVLREFDSAASYNLNLHANGDAAEELFLYFDRLRDEGTLNATVFSRLDLCLAIGGGSLGGIIIGAVAVYVRYETKKRKDDKEKEEN